MEQFIMNVLLFIILIILKISNYVELMNQKKPGLIYIMLWTDNNRPPFVWWEKKRKSVKSMNCKFQNCFIVKERDYFVDPTDYDAILFNPQGLSGDMPPMRSDNQLYVFVGLESATFLPLGDEWNWVFNYTWTYKLDSDLTLPYVVVNNKHGDVIGPKVNIHWRNVSMMRPIEDYVVEKLQSKKIAAAWFITNCKGSNNKRLLYGHNIGSALTKYNLTLDVYGKCGNRVCPSSNFEECRRIIEEKYYFYFAFENSNCEDYVTEKLLTALNHYTVPVVLGGANYSRFMPDGIYLNGNSLTEEEVAFKINEAIQDKQKYYDYFKWHRYYSYEAMTTGGDKDPLCSFCAFLNDESVRSRRRVYAKFTDWWNECGNRNDNEEIIVKYEDSAPHIKSVVTYRDKNTETETNDPPSTFEKVNNFVGDLISYYFDT